MGSGKVRPKRRKKSQKVDDNHFVYFPTLKPIHGVIGFCGHCTSYFVMIVEGDRWGYVPYELQDAKEGIRVLNGLVDFYVQTEAWEMARELVGVEDGEDGETGENLQFKT